MRDPLSTPSGPPKPLQGLARRLVNDGALSESQAWHVEQEARRDGGSFLERVVAQGLVEARHAALAAGREFGLPVIDLEALRLDALPRADRFPEGILRRLKVLPLACHGHQVTVAVPCPSTLARLDELRFATGLTPEGVLAPADQFDPTLDAYLSRSEREMLARLHDVDDAIGELAYEETGHGEQALPADVDTTGDEAPIVKFVNKILLDAIRRRASDIHFEPYESDYRVRFRIDGLLHEMARPPFSMRHRIAARLKVMARLDIAERRLPQDGAIRLRLSQNRSIDFRVSSLPTVYGEKVVLRLLDPDSTQMDIEQLGFSAAQLALYEAALAHPQGMILVAGPTGSGKTVTLHTGIRRLNREERNICTAEDPVEIKVPGVNQVSVLPRIGLTFANALRAFLRQDPDVVMVGEIRDLETAEIAVKASQTGHLVLSTVHTNSAAEILTRLAGMGVAPFDIAGSVSLIIAQRLARRLCPHCKRPTTLPRQILVQQGFLEEELPEATLFDATGCRHCLNGYRGRVGIYELVPVSEAMSRLIMERGNAMDLDRLARTEGHPSLRRSGLQKVLQGITSLTEVNRITKG